MVRLEVTEGVFLEISEDSEFLKELKADLAEEAEWRKFYEYEKHKGEADFDWDYYSDWHKDLYGFRPRW